MARRRRTVAHGVPCSSPQLVGCFVVSHAAYFLSGFSILVRCVLMCRVPPAPPARAPTQRPDGPRPNIQKGDDPKTSSTINRTKRAPTQQKVVTGAPLVLLFEHRPLLWRVWGRGAKLDDKVSEVGIRSTQVRRHPHSTN